MWGLLLYSSKWFVKPLMGKWFIRILWAVPLLIYRGMFVY